MNPVRFGSIYIVDKSAKLLANSLQQHVNDKDTDNTFQRASQKFNTFLHGDEQQYMGQPMPDGRFAYLTGEDAEAANWEYTFDQKGPNQQDVIDAFIERRQAAGSKVVVNNGLEILYRLLGKVGGTEVRKPFRFLLNESTPLPTRVAQLEQHLERQRTGGVVSYLYTNMMTALAKLVNE